MSGVLSHTPQDATETVMVNVERQAQVHGSSCTGLRAEVRYVISGPAGTIVEAVRQQIPDGWTSASEMPWTAVPDGQGIFPGHDLGAGPLEVAAHLVVAATRTEQLADVPTLDVFAVGSDGQAVSVVADATPLPAPPLNVAQLRMTAADAPAGQVAVEVHNDSVWAVEVDLHLDGLVPPDQARHTTGVVAGDHVRVCVPAGGPVTVAVAATNPNGVAVPSDLLPAPVTVVPIPRDSSPPEDVPLPRGQVALAPLPWDGEHLSSPCDTGRPYLLDGPDQPRVGDVVEIGVPVVNQTGDMMTYATVIASMPDSVTLRDDRWAEHSPGRVQITQMGLPDGHHVVVPLRLRMDKATTVAVSFEVDQ